MFTSLIFIGIAIVILVIAHRRKILWRGAFFCGLCCLAAVLVPVPVVVVAWEAVRRTVSHAASKLILLRQEFCQLTLKVTATVLALGLRVPKVTFVTDKLFV